MAAPLVYRSHNGVPVKSLLPSTNVLEKVTPATDPGQIVTVTDPGPYDVRLLFMIDGMKVYRFTDGGHYVYVVDGRNSKTAWKEATPVGKTVVMTPMEVPTVK